MFCEAFHLRMWTSQLSISSLRYCEECDFSASFLMCLILLFQALSVEYIHIDGDDDKHSLREFMNEKGYTVRAEITDTKWRANDYIFVKKGFNEDIELPNIHTKNGEVPILE